LQQPLKFLRVLKTPSLVLFIDGLPKDKAQKLKDDVDTVALEYHQKEESLKFFFTTAE
jgi:hypothetical protein